MNDVIAKINRSRHGTVFFLDSFRPLSDAYAGNVLSSLTKDGALIRISKGIYVKPTIGTFGVQLPHTDEIVKSIAKREHSRVIPSGELLINAMGISEQVPSGIKYLTTSSSRKLVLGGYNVTLTHAMPRTFIYSTDVIVEIVIVLKYLGKATIDYKILQKIRECMVLSKEPKEVLLQDIMLAPAWIRKHIKPIILDL